MSNGSPSAYLLWALLSVAFFTFMLIHLWAYDKFKCLRWDSGRQPGAFKRVMTYSYFATVPLLMVFSVAMAALKYQEGSVLMPDESIIPRPFSAWRHDRLRFVVPLFFILSIAWSLELVTHLEELTFWLFLLHQGPRKREWFHSWEFRTWYLGSLIAVLGMPLTALMKRKNVETCLLWIFLGGASAGTLTTVCFIYVLVNFPGFIRRVKAEGAEPDVVVRLATFYHLNCIRVVFRFLFTVPLLTLAIDGLIDRSYVVVSSPFWLDFMLMTAGLGCFVSSAITMLIFFPRSIMFESGYKAHAASHHSKGHTGPAPVQATPLPDYERRPPSPKSITSLEPAPSPHILMHQQEATHRYHDLDVENLPQHYALEAPRPNPRPISGSRSEDTMWDASTSTARPRSMNVHGTPIYLEEVAPSPPYPLVHPYAMNFTSPIDLEDGS
ncbi:hypothetical protein C8J57DRAFT_573153 [Mycena rebaudengoi]|nr:hypothetical protein C8J57DRAFT_573153 [Mycena rebaudengoi]